MNLGRRQDLSNQFSGTIDEVIIFNKTLSAEQVSALYNNRTDLIVSNETTTGDIWQVEVTPNDNIADGISVLSNNLSLPVPVPIDLINATTDSIQYNSGNDVTFTAYLSGNTTNIILLIDDDTTFLNCSYTDQ
ncbi:MAG: hypothetical protein ACW96U_10905, partial [Candidatus Heimdallarchaeaceae archaeon]